MRRYPNISVLSAILVLSVCAFAQREMYPPWPPQDQANTWEFKVDESNVQTMTRHFPYGAIDRWLTIVPGNDPKRPLRGACRFPNGFSRPMTEGELAYFWEYAGARHAFEAKKKR